MKRVLNTKGLKTPERKMKRVFNTKDLKARKKKEGTLSDQKGRHTINSRPQTS
jgi:hypothetical protein